jgi:cell division septation protein DedD
VSEGSAAKKSQASKASKRPAQTAAVAPAATAPARAAKTGGKYKVHIAAVRSRDEAEALAQKLVAQHGAELADHAPTVDKAVIGSMGTFYRVRIGGYASQDEPRGLCNKLRTSGLDCLVVTN